MRGRSDDLEVIAGIAEVDPLVFQARGYAPQITDLKVSEELLLIRIQ